MPSNNEGNSVFCSIEDAQWKTRYTKIGEVIRSLDPDTTEEVNIRVSDLLSDFFGDYPPVKMLLDKGLTSQEVYPFIIPVTEDVLRELDLYND